jgi:hypothetical protein
MSLKHRIQEIRKEVSKARCRAKSGEELCPAAWVIENALAIIQRPLRDHPIFGGSGKAVPYAARTQIDRWAEELRAKGFRAVLCLSHGKELAHYDGLYLDSGGLLGHLRQIGFEVAHVPALDPAHAITPEERQLRKTAVDDVNIKASMKFKALPKPVAIFCSSGIDRSTPIAAYIEARRA